MTLLLGESQINVHIENCDRLRITVDFATLLMTRPGGTHSNISMKVGRLYTSAVILLKITVSLKWNFIFP